MNEERLQKALARAGIASRRASEDLMAAGRVKVNGKIVTELGYKIDPARDRVTVDDEPVAVRPSAAPQKIYIMLNKPQGYLSTVSDPQGRPTVMDLVNLEKAGRLFPVGRLDMDTEGLLLLTNDGAFSQALSHPRFGVEKEYVALLDGIIAMKDIEALRQGVSIPVEDPETGERTTYPARAVKVDLIRHEGSNSLVRFILKEGKKRQIRLMSEAVEHYVLELKRVRFGLLRLGDLGSGKWRNLSKEEVHSLVESARQRAANPNRPDAPEAARPRPGSRTYREDPGGPRRPGPFPRRPEEDTGPRNAASSGSYPRRNTNFDESRSARRSANFDEGRPARGNANFDEGRPARRNANIDDGRPARRNANFDEGRPARGNTNFDEGRPARRNTNFDEGRPARRGGTFSEQPGNSEDNRRSFPRRRPDSPPEEARRGYNPGPRQPGPENPAPSRNAPSTNFPGKRPAPPDNARPGGGTRRRNPVPFRAPGEPGRRSPDRDSGPEPRRGGPARRDNRV